MKKHLVLDGGGVIFTEPVPALLRRMTGDRSLDEIEDFYYDELYDDLWGGTIDEAEFWQEMADFSGSGFENLKNYFFQNLSLSPAATQLALWQKRADVSLLSNHRSEWIAPLLQELPIRFSNTWVSEERGIVKPEKEAFAPLLLLEEEVLYVDDNETNIEVAEELGISSLLAQEGGAWMYDVASWLGFTNPE